MIDSIFYVVGAIVSTVIIAIFLLLFLEFILFSFSFFVFQWYCYFKTDKENRPNFYKFIFNTILKFFVIIIVNIMTLGLNEEYYFNNKRFITKNGNIFKYNKYFKFGLLDL